MPMQNQPNQQQGGFPHPQQMGGVNMGFPNQIQPPRHPQPGYAQPVSSQGNYPQAPNQPPTTMGPGSQNFNQSQQYPGSGFGSFGPQGPQQPPQQQGPQLQGPQPPQQPQQQGPNQQGPQQPPQQQQKMPQNVYGGAPPQQQNFQPPSGPNSFQQPPRGNSPGGYMQGAPPPSAANPHRMFGRGAYRPRQAGPGYQ
uniref:Uncharacterized protein n=1 Tax=Ciona savignyi TaxID=51511 RepID=H2Y437_CIOSA